jgi:nucleoside-diphosphate-sugar epimerase
MARVIVFGGSGYVGKNISNFLFKNGHDVVALGRSQCDLEAQSSISFIVKLLEKEPAHIVFASALTRTKGDTLDTCFDNVRQVEMLSKSFTQTKPQSFCFLSAADVYGHSGRMVKEHTPLNPMNPYGAYKVFSEQILKFALKGVAPLNILRFSGIFGGLNDKFSLVSRFAEAIKNGKKITLNKNGQVYRDFVPIELLQESIQRCIDIPKDRTVNIASGYDMTILQCINLIESSLNIEASIELLDNQGDRDFDLSLSNSKLLIEFPEMASFDIQQYIKKFLKEANSV